MICSLCPRQCKAIRTEKENINGFCKMPLLPKVARAALHFWEEPCISGVNGSGTVFFSGCSLACVYCQNYEISHLGKGEIISYEKLADIFKALEQQGAHNINLVSPTHYVLAIKKALDIYKPEIPIVYNSGGYDSVETLKSLDGYIDIFLMDLKYLSDQRAKLYSEAENYPTVAKNAILEVYRQQSQCVLRNGIMQNGVIIRHLLLPQATKEAMEVFDWVRDNTPNAYFSFMSQYLPLNEAEKMPVINRKVTNREYDKVIDYISGFDFRNIFIQEKSSADKSYIPDFYNKIQEMY